MGRLVIDQNKVNDNVAFELKKLCPFGAFDYENGILSFNAGCKMCRLCVKKGPAGVVTYVEEKPLVTLNKAEWNGICVYIEIDIDGIHPVSLELIGKAKELANKINHPVMAVLIGNEECITKHKDELLEYGVDKLYVYQNEKYKEFNIETYSKALENFVNQIKPVAILYGGTYLGRSIAPRVAAKFRTGLTADCTSLDIKENTDLIQVRPAFGGNVMAQIICPNTRPQMATVRYKIFKKPNKVLPTGSVIYMPTENLDFNTGIKLLDIKIKEKSVDISEADIVVAVGRPFKTEDDFKMAEELASLLGGVVACSRPLVESGLKDIKYQIGLSGKTVAPKLIITLGISGSVQFSAGMSGAEQIISINSDPNAPIFEIANYGIVGDVFKIVPKLIENIKNKKN